MTTIHEFDIRDQEISNITILSDRAEVKRIVPIALKAGIHEVRLKNFSPCLQSDSVRVDGRGNATICDVKERDIFVLKAQMDTSKIAELRKELKNCESAREREEDRKGIIVKKIDGLDRAVAEIGKRVMNPPKESGSVVIDQQYLNGLQNLFNFHETESELLKIAFRETEQEIKKLVEMEGKLKSEMNGNTNAGQGRKSRTVIITLEAFEEGNAQVEVTYQVIKAGWQPSYDIRVDTEKPSMTVTYYGKLRNHCGEDWNEFPAILSTAQPSLGGRIPELGTLEAYFYRPVPQQHYSNVRSLSMRSSPQNRMYEPQMRREQQQSAPAPPPAPMAPPPPMEVTEKALCHEFKIARKTTLPNGTDDHKVIIGTVVLTPSLIHESVPSKTAVAFLTASTVNTSSLPFLAGEASIFLDAAFVAKSHIKNVSPGEKFTCSLGVDTAIRIDYKPAKKFHEEAGYITKHSAQVTEQTISVKNTRTGQPVFLTIKHHVPRSTDEKIRVKLAAPDVDSNEGARITKDHNLEWTVKVAPNTSKNFLIKWIVEHAKGREIVFQEKF